MPTRRKNPTPGKRPSLRSAGPSHGKRAGSRPAPFGTVGNRKKGAYNAGRSGFSTTHAGASPFASGSSKRPQQQNGGFPQMLLTRRNLLIGAGVVGGAVAVGGVGSALTSGANSSESQTTSISVAEDAVTNLDALSEASWEDHLTLSGSYKLPYGTLVWADDPSYAACLVPTGSSSPLNEVRLLNLGTGSTTTVLKQGQGQDEGFDILDVRATDEGLVWIEANIFEQRWRVLTARLSGGQASAIQRVDEGDSTWRIPSIAAAGQRAFWQLTPDAEGSAKKEPSVLKTATFGSDQSDVAWTSKSAFATRPAASDDAVVITPRAESTSTYYQLTRLAASDAGMTHQITLPASMTPSMASYGRSGFSFSFADIYSYGAGISNLGTYTPMVEDPQSYDGIPWFRFGRTPSANPCWCGEWFMVKSTRALAGIHFASKSYFMIDAPNATDSYGEYLVSSGTGSRVVGLSQIKPVAAKGSNGQTDNHALVRVFTAKKNSIGSAFA